CFLFHNIWLLNDILFQLRQILCAGRWRCEVMVHLLFLFSRHSAGSARSASGGNGRHCKLAAIPMSAGINE
ncbi:MAG: hypothetical protein ABN483_18555, partial [Pantoea agglomerans]